MIGDYHTRYQIQDLKQENAALACLLEKGVGQTMAEDIATAMQQATEMLSKPRVYAFGFGEVFIGVGTIGNDYAMTFMDANGPHPLGPVPEEKNRKIDRDSTILTFANVDGLDVLIASAKRMREMMTGLPSPSEQILRIAVEFIEQNKVKFPESTIRDCVYENAPALVEQLAEIVGYAKDDDHDDEA
jgi:hypothetical protein